MEIADLSQHQLVQNGRELLQISNIYPPRPEAEGSGYVTAQLVYPVPERTTVRSYTVDEIAKFREPTSRIVSAYDKEYAR